MSELTEKIQKEMDVWEDLREYGIFEGVGIAKEIIEEHELQHEIKLNDNQKIVLEWLKEAYKRTKWSSPFGTVYSTINIHELFVRTRLTKAQQFQVLAAFAQWGLEQEEE